MSLWQDWYFDMVRNSQAPPYIVDAYKAANLGTGNKNIDQIALLVFGREDAANVDWRLFQFGHLEFKKDVLPQPLLVSGMHVCRILRKRYFNKKIPYWVAKEIRAHAPVIEPRVFEVMAPQDFENLAAEYVAMLAPREKKGVVLAMSLLYYCGLSTQNVKRLCLGHIFQQDSKIALFSCNRLHELPPLVTERLNDYLQTDRRSVRRISSSPIPLNSRRVFTQAILTKIAEFDNLSCTYKYIKANVR
jgi:hypothetical protein